MTTYRQAADLAFQKVVKLIGDYSIFKTTNGYWHQANTLDTCLQYLLLSRSGNNPDKQNLVVNALDKVFDPRMEDENHVPVPPQDWGDWSRRKGGGGPWSDDYGWWGIALTRAYRNRSRLGYDASVSDRILKYARNCFAAISYAWDDSEAVPKSGVFGGAWNHQDTTQAMTGRNSVTNETLWLFGQRMATLEPQNPVYQKQVDKSSKFFYDAKAITANNPGALLTADGLVLERLEGMENGYKGWYWVGDQGLFTAACLGFNAPSGDTTTAMALAESVKTAMVDTAGGVLHDTLPPNSDFNDDYATGKGIFMRNWINWAAGFATRPSFYDNLIIANATSLWNNRVNPNAPGDDKYQFGFNWNPAGKPYDKGGEPQYPGNVKDPSDFSKLVIEVAGLAALNAVCTLGADADQEIPAKIPALAR